MRQQMPRPGQVKLFRRHDHLDHVVLVIREIADMAGAGIGLQAVRHALTAPVDRQDVVTLGHQAMGDGGVFLDVFGPPGEQQHAAACRIRGPMRHAQADPIAGLRPEGAGGLRSVVRKLMEGCLLHAGA